MDKWGNLPFTFKRLEEAIVAFNKNSPEYNEHVIWGLEIFDMGNQLGVGFYNGDKRDAVRINLPKT